MEEEKVKESTKQTSQNEMGTRESNRFKEFSRQFQIDLQNQANKESATIETTAPSLLTESTEPVRRTSSKQRKASLDEYRELFLKVPKITDRQPVFVSRSTRDRIDDIVRRLGERRMSVSGFLENLANHHLETYLEEVEQWKRL